MSIPVTLTNNSGFTLVRYIIWHGSLQDSFFHCQPAGYGVNVANGTQGRQVGTISPSSSGQDYWGMVVVTPSGCVWWSEITQCSVLDETSVSVVVNAPTATAGLTFTVGTSGQQIVMSPLGGGSLNITCSSTAAVAGSVVRLWANASYAAIPGSLTWTSSAGELSSTSGLYTELTMPSSSTSAVTVTVTDPVSGISGNVSIDLVSGGVISITPAAPIVAQGVEFTLSTEGGVSASWTAPEAQVEWITDQTGSSVTLKCRATGQVQITAAADGYQSGLANVTSVVPSVATDVEVMAYGADGNTYIVSSSGAPTNVGSYSIPEPIRELLSSGKQYIGASYGASFVACKVMNVQSFLAWT